MGFLWRNVNNRQKGYLNIRLAKLKNHVLSNKADYKAGAATMIGAKKTSTKRGIRMESLFKQRVKLGCPK